MSDNLTVYVDEIDISSLTKNKKSDENINIDEYTDSIENQWELEWEIEEKRMILSFNDINEEEKE